MCGVGGGFWLQFVSVQSHTAAPARACDGRSSTGSTAHLSLAEAVKDVTAAVHLSRHIIMRMGVLMQA